MSFRHHTLAAVRAVLLALIAVGRPAAASTQASPATAGETLRSPLFADVWIGGPLDSIYNAEYTRLQELCEPAETRCFTDRLDTTAVALATVRSAPEDPKPAGRLMAALRARGRYPYATLLVRPAIGPDLTLVDDAGDWGYGVTLALADTASHWIRPIVPAMDSPLWLPRDQGGQGFGVMEVYGLEGRLWRLGPVNGARRKDGTPAELPRGVYLVLDVTGGVIRLRPEVPSDMACGEDAPDPEEVPTYTVALDRLVSPGRVPAVEKAYPKGC